MTIVIFRTCVEHDYICRLSYTSYRMAGVGDRFVFLCQRNHTFSHIANLDAQYTYHEADGNFGGQLSVKALWDALRRVDDIEDNDTVFLSDSDIVIRSSPMEELNSTPWQHRGMMCSYPHLKYFQHSSGQCQILKGDIVKRLRSQDNQYVDNVWMNEMIPENICVSDDTFLSWETEKMGILKVPMTVSDGYPTYWIHWKYPHLEAKFGTDYEAAVRYILQDTRRGYSCIKPMYNASMNIQSIVDPSLILCAYTSSLDTRQMLSAANQSLQIGVIPLKAGVATQPHAHLPLERVTQNTQECWVVISGELKISVYDTNDSYVTTISICAGCVFVTFAGGHSLTASEDSVIVEIKNGPYLGKSSDYRVINV